MDQLLKKYEKELEKEESTAPPQKQSSSDTKKPSKSQTTKNVKKPPAGKHRRTRTKSKVMGSMALNLHPIEEQESDDENGSDEELNKSYDRCLGVKNTFNTIDVSTDRKSLQVAKSVSPMKKPIIPSLKLSEIPKKVEEKPKVPMLDLPVTSKAKSLGIPGMDNSKLKQFIQNRDNQQEEPALEVEKRNNNQNEELGNNQDLSGKKFSKWRL